MTTVPRLLVLTDRHRCRRAGRDLAATVAALASAGAPAIVYREKDLPPAERHGLGVEVAAAVRGTPALLLVASDAGLATQLGADGCHLAAADDRPEERDPAWLLGRSCHDHAEVAAADGEPIDYVTVSPYAATDSKPGYGPPLGIEGVAALAAAIRHPALALGGVRPHHLAGLLAAGVHGIAVMGGVMGAADPAAATVELLQTLERHASDDPSGDRPPANPPRQEKP